jgi:RNA polymerase sigma factor (TIGR02999 family)
MFGIIGPMHEVTQILRAIDSGDAGAAGELLPLVYGELRKLAAARLAHEKAGQTLQATSLVHEAYVRLVDVKQAQRWDGRGHFFAAAAEAMRRIVIEDVRRKRAQKRGGELRRIDIDAVEHVAAGREDELLALDEALERLEARWPDRAALVKLRYFAGMSLPEASQAMGISLSTAQRHWTFARAWLHSQLGPDED